MIIKRGVFEDFRCFEGEVDFELVPGVNILYGANAQGKTSVLEAIYVVSQGRSFRTNRDADMINIYSHFAKTYFAFDKTANGENEPQMAGIVFHREGKPSRENEINGYFVDSYAEIIGQLRTVLFTPQHLDIVSGSPESRRRFLNMALCQLSKTYMKALQCYEKALRQRAVVLKNLRFQGKTAGDDLLHAVDETLISYGVQISKIRAQYLSQLVPYIRQVYADMTGGKERPAIFVRETVDEEEYRSRMAASEKEDIRRGTTAIGPHRGDFEMHVNQMNLKTYGSQGQIRTMTLALKIAEGRVSHKHFGEPPVYLFDDVFSELDENRRNYLLSHCMDGQVLITTCEPVNRGKIFEVGGGKIIQRSE